MCGRGARSVPLHPRGERRSDAATGAKACKAVILSGQGENGVGTGCKERVPHTPHLWVSHEQPVLQASALVSQLLHPGLEPLLLPLLRRVWGKGVSHRSWQQAWVSKMGISTTYV